MDAAQKGAHACYQLAGAEGLDQVVVGTQLEADDAVFNLALRRQHDDGHIGVIADGAANALAGNAGKHEIEHHQVEMVLGEFLQGLLAVAHRGNPVVLALQICRHRIADGLLVFHQKDASGFVAHFLLLSISLHAQRQGADRACKIIGRRGHCPSKPSSARCNFQIILAIAPPPHRKAPLE